MSWYKTWYVAAAIAVAVVCLAAVTRCIRTDGLFPAMLPVLGYFALLLLTAAWAEFPRETVRCVIVDSIEIAVFALFYLAARNSDPEEIAVAIATLVIPAMVAAVYDYVDNPFASRIGGYSLALLPLVIAFSAPQRHRVHAVAMSLAFALLFVGRSRTPLVAAIIVAILSVLASRDRLRKGAGMLAAASAIAMAIAILPPTRPLLITTVARFTRELPPTTLDARLVSEIRGTKYRWQVRQRGEVSVRTTIADLSRRLLRESFPLGIGYMNFQLHFEKAYGYRAALHSMYATWLIEGGLLVALYVAAFGSWLVVRLWRCADARAILIGLMAVLLIGAFHQMHQAPALWMLLGMGWGRVRSCEGRRHTHRSYSQFPVALGGELLRP